MVLDKISLFKFLVMAWMVLEKILSKSGLMALMVLKIFLKNPVVTD